MDEHGTSIINSFSRSPAPAISLDYELFAHFLDDADLTEDQKREFLEALWSIIIEFVALGFDVHPAQQAQLACGKLSQSRTNPPITGPDAVECEGPFLANDFSDATGGDSPQVAERIQK